MSSKLLATGIENNFEALSINNSDWNQPIVDAAWDLLDCIADLDGLFNFGSNNQIWNEICCGDHNVSFALLYRDRLEKIYNSIVVILCQYLLFEDSLYTCLEIFNLYRSVVYPNAFCFAIPMLDEGALVSFVSRNQVNISWPAFAQTNKPFMVYLGTSLLTWPLSSLKVDDALFMSETMNSQLLLADERVLLKYFISVTVAESRKTSPCYTGDSPACCSIL